MAKSKKPNSTTTPKRKPESAIEHVAPAKHAGGRPTKYRAEYCGMLLDYFRDAEDHRFPTFAGFAAKIGARRQSLLDWCKQNPEFSDAYARAREFQESYLIEGALTGKFNPHFAAFTAKNLLGWRDKTDIEHSGEQAITINIVEKFPEG